MPGTPRAGFRPDIEGLRAVAVLLVLLFHAGLPLSGGFAGVDVFFVSSGFLITGLLLREVETTGTIRFVDFYARRARRLLPAAAAVLLVSAGLAAFLAPPTRRPAFGLDVISAAAFTANWRFAARSVDYWAGELGRSPVLHFWSLSVEEQFYVLWPGLIAVAVYAANRVRRAPREVIAVALVLTLALSWFFSIELTSAVGAQAFFSTGARLWELGMGAVVALAMRRPPAVLARRGFASAFFGVGLVGVSALGWAAKGDWPGWRALVPTIGTALVIAGGTMSPRNAISRVLSSRALGWIGERSYSLYLWHWPFLVIGQDWLGHHGRAWGIALVLLSGVPAWLSHRILERPIRFSHLLAERPKLTLSLGANGVMASIGAGLVLQLLPVASSAAAARANVVPAARRPLGAAALGRRPRESEAGEPHASYARMAPPPDRAPSDVSRGHDRCQLSDLDTRSPACEIGSPMGSVRMVVVGDSKAFQYYDAFDEVGKALDWRISTATKGACPFADVMVHHKGRPFEPCREFYLHTLEELRAHPPDVIITSQASNRGFVPGGATEEATVETTEAMVDGLARTWTEVLSWGTKLAVIVDHPTPGAFAPTPECLLTNTRDASKCAFDREAGAESSAAGVQRAASERVAGARLIDLTDFICPQPRCAPVIGDVVVYRDATHLTNTYARSLAPMLTAKLAVAFADEPR